MQKLIKSTLTSPTGNAGATSFPPFGDIFVYSETSQNNSGNANVFVRFERTDNI